MYKALVLLALCLTAQQAEGWWGSEDGDPDSAVVVGARIETCRQCRLNYLPRVRNFIDNYLPQYPALRIRFIPGAPPELFLLNKYGGVVEKHDLEIHDEKSIPRLLEKHGITKKTPAPEYTMRNFDKTEHCLAFRGREECTLKEDRSLRRDKHCNAEIASDDAGFCECTPDISLPVLCGDRDLKLTCQALCEDVIDGEEANLD